MKRDKALKTLFVTLTATIAFSGCVGASISDIDQATYRGDYKAAAQESDKMKDLDSKLDESNQLPTLYAGNSYLYAQDYETSIQRFNEAERIMKFHNEEILLGSTANLIAQLLINDAVIDYHSTMSEGIMINTYKAIDYMALSQFDEARVEFNRAIDRQRRAKEEYAKLISKYQHAIDEKESIERKNIQERNELARRNPNIRPSNIDLNINKTINNPKIEELLKSRYPSLYSFRAYPDFINPFTNYLAGIFFLTQNDYTKSADLLKEVYGMTPDNTTVKSDLVLVEDILDAKKRDVNYVWVIYSNGLAPKKEQFKINIPLFIITDRISYTGIALPKLVPQQEAASYISVFNSQNLLAKTQEFASMDRVILTEFKYSYKYIVARAAFGAAIKTFLQYRIYEDYGQYAGLAAGVVQYALTQADTRVWGNLPKEYQIARVEMPKDKKISIETGYETLHVDLGDSKNAIVFVRLPKADSKAGLIVIKL